MSLQIHRHSSVASTRAKALLAASFHYYYERSVLPASGSNQCFLPKIGTELFLLSSLILCAIQIIY